MGWANGPAGRGAARPHHSVLVALGWAMSVLGVLTGVCFPFLAALLGLPAREVLRPLFFLATISAGILVGTLNYVLARQVVGRRLRALITQISGVEQALLHNTTTGDWSADRCRLKVDSDDELGEAAAAYNRLVAALTLSHQVDRAVSAVTVACTGELHLEALCAAALSAVVTETGASEGALVVGLDAAPKVLARTEGVASDAALLASTLPAGTGRLKVVPLRSNTDVVGHLVLADVPDRLGTARLLDVLAERLGAAVGNAALHQRVTELADTDELTGLDNRRHGLDELRVALAEARRGGADVAILMVDLDRFKQVNDTYGHLAGDRLLRQVAQACREVLREGDLIMRYGGEEFLVLLPGADEQQACVIAERLRGAVAALPAVEGTPGPVATVSVGCASTAVAADADLEWVERELIRRADLALYEAKDAGRNRCRQAAAGLAC